NSVPEVSRPAGVLFDSMHFGFYYRPSANRIAFFYAPDTGESPCCYDTIVSESRIASYIGIAKGELPPKEYFGAWRTFPDSCDWSWQETKPYGYYATYYGVRVFEGAYNYAGMRVVPGWGGSMFEALLPALFVPEERWGPHSWKLNHPNTVAAQIYHGLHEAEYGYWGFSPSDNPSPANANDNYRVYGVDGIGMNPDGYPSNNDNTYIDHGFAGCRPGKADPPPPTYTNGVVTPHASFLALSWAPLESLRNLANLRRDFDIYGHWGFRDAVNVDTGQVDRHYLSLDQGIIMAAIGNAIGQDFLRKAWATPQFRRRLQPVIQVERFNSTKPRGLR
ncbi:MAG: cellobiose phosphorylase, partial [Chloroflexota bacterium]|nr:cellobiose phosphorylase [Chloroflexota bacterium]